MKTLTKDNLSLYLVEDNDTLVLTEENITVGDPARFIIGDCTSENTVLHEGVSNLEDWYPGKYFYDNTTWTLNPDWVEPTPEPQE